MLYKICLLLVITYNSLGYDGNGATENHVTNCKCTLLQTGSPNQAGSQDEHQKVISGTMEQEFSGQDCRSSQKETQGGDWVRSQATFDSIPYMK